LVKTMIFNYVNPAHILFKHQIPQIVFVTITKTIRGQDALSVTKVLCGPRETVISRDRWLVVVTVVVLCLLTVNNCIKVRL
jgi:hypothetical protein